MSNRFFATVELATDEETDNLISETRELVEKLEDNVRRLRRNFTRFSIDKAPSEETDEAAD